MYTLERITAEFHEVCRNAGVECGAPIKLNGRLSRTLGQVVINTAFTPCRIERVEFSKKLLAESEDESIRQALLHEAAHYIATMRSGVDHGHDAYFKAICAEIGCAANGTTLKVKRLKDAPAEHKYEIFCENCGSLGGYARMCSTLRNINSCRCKKCNGKVTYKQNW